MKFTLLIATLLAISCSLGHSAPFGPRFRNILGNLGIFPTQATGEKVSAQQDHSDNNAVLEGKNTMMESDEAQLMAAILMDGDEDRAMADLQNLNRITNAFNRLRERFGG